MAVIGATGIEPVNFLEQYAKGLQVGAGRRQLERQEIDRIKAAEQQRTMNELYAQSLRAGGGLDTNALIRGMARQGLGSAIPAFQAEQAKIAQATAAASKSSAEADKLFWQTSRDQLAAIPENDQTAYQSWATNLVNRAPWAVDLLPATLDAANKKRLLMTADMVLPKGEKVDLGGGTAFFNPYTREQIGEVIENIPDPEAVIQAKERVARAGAESPAAKKFSGVFGERAAVQFDNLFTQAQSAETSLNLSRRLKPLLENPNFISGTLGNVRLELAKALGLPGAEETQSYFAGIGGQVAQIIKNFGAGTGLSNKDLEFAEKMAGGNINLTPDAIKRIVRLNDESSKYLLNRYNKRRNELSKKDSEILDFYPEIKVVTRTGTLNGRQVVQYSDGTTEYAD